MVDRAIKEDLEGFAEGCCACAGEAGADDLDSAAGLGG